MAVNPDKNGVEQSLIARLIGKIKRIVLDINGAVSAEETRATAAEAAAKTEVVQGENCTIEKTTAADGHDVYTINADGKPQIPADWEQQDSGKPDYIKNKPNIALKEDVANKKQSIDPTSTTEYGSSKAVADFVNSSVATSTANFLGGFTLTDLSLTYPATDVQIAAALNSHTWPSGVTPTNNDYVYVEIQDPQTTGVDDKVERFKFSSLLASWGYEYTLNNSSFTAAEIAAIDSGITATDKTNYDNHLANTNNPHNVTAAQVGAEPAFSVLPVSKGGTNADDAKEAAYNLFNNQVLNDSNAPTDDSILMFRLGTPTASNGYFLTRKVSYLWNYIKGKISSVLGLSENGYTGNAATATSATTAAGYTDDGAIATALADKYVKPSGGIPKTDLASDVQTSLGKADSALQSHQSVTDNNPTLGWGATSKVGTVGSTDLRVTMPSNPASASQRKFFSIYANSTKIIKLFRVYKFTAGSSIGTTVELIGRAGGTAVRVVINIKASITADYIQFYDYAGDTSHYFTLYVAQDPDNSSKNLVYASINLYGALYLNASDASAGDSDIDFSVFGDVMSGRISGDAAITLRNMQDASWINSGTFDAARIPTSLPNVSVGSAATATTATHLSANGVWNTWSSGSYNSSTPYALIGEVSLNISSNDNGAGQLLQLEFGNSDIAIIKLNFSTGGNSSVNASKVKVLFSTWTPSGLANRLDVRYFKFDNDSKLAIRFYVKFTGNWQVFRLRQFDCQSGDNGFVNWVPISFYSGSDSTLNPVGTAATFEYLQVQYTPGSAVGSTTTPVYVDSNGNVQPCTPSSMSVGSATSATNVNLSKTTDSTIGDTIKAGNGSGVLIDNAGNAYRWGGYRLSFGTFSIQDNTICIV